MELKSFDTQRFVTHAELSKAEAAWAQELGHLRDYVAGQRKYLAVALLASLQAFGVAVFVLVRSC